MRAAPQTAYPGNAGKTSRSRSAPRSRRILTRLEISWGISVISTAIRRPSAGLRVHSARHLPGRLAGGCAVGLDANPSRR